MPTPDPEIRFLPCPAGDRCGICGEGLRGHVLDTCPGCDVRLHRDCHGFAGSCGTYGCGSRPPPLRRASYPQRRGRFARPPPPPRPRPLAPVLRTARPSAAPDENLALFLSLALEAFFHLFFLALG